MRAFRVTIPFKKHPWYTVSRIEAASKSLAITMAKTQLYLEQPNLASVKHQKPIAKEVL